MHHSGELRLEATHSTYNADPLTPNRGYTSLAVIDLEQLRKNARIIKQIAEPAEVMAVVKANAYGHGVLEVTRVLLEERYNYFLVATLPEALHLRANGVDANILVSMPPLPGNLTVYSAEQLDVSVSTQEVFDAIEAAGESGLPLRVHVKIDTGMSRLGLSPTFIHTYIKRIAAHPSIQVRGIWTHLATAGEADTSFAKQQIREAQALLNRLPGFDGYFHVGNSSSLLHNSSYLPPQPESMYRIGGALLGMTSFRAQAQMLGIHTLLTFKSYVLTVKEIRAGETVSYGRTWTATKKTRIAVIGAGYGDGYPGTTFPGSGTSVDTPRVKIKGHYVPIVGRVCMDMFMVDVGELAIEPGDEVILFGKGGPEIQEVAQHANRKAYEICCGISHRVVRCYI